MSVEEEEELGVVVQALEGTGKEEGVDILPDAGLGRRLVKSPENLNESVARIKEETSTRDLNKELTGEYEKPNPRIAREYRKYHHPHEESGELKSLCNTNTGVFYRICCCRKRRDNDEMLVYGPGVSSYFKYLKFMGFTFFIMVVLSIPALVFNIYSGEYYSNSVIPLSQTTLGNLYRPPQNVNGTLVFDFDNYVLRIGVLCSQQDAIVQTICNVPRTFLLFVYALLDILIMIIFLFAVSMASRGIQHEQYKFAGQVPRLEDYSVQVYPLPNDTTAKDLKDHFEELTSFHTVYDSQVQEMSGKAISLCIQRGKLMRQAARQNAYVKRLRASKVVSEATNTLGSLLSSTMDRRKKKASDLTVEAGEDSPGLSRAKEERARRVQRAAKRFTEYQEKIKEIDTQTVQLIDKSAEELSFGYVTFHSQFTRQEVLRMYSKIRCSQPKRMRLKGTVIKVVPAPAPSTLVWENNEIGRFSRSVRSFISLLILIVVLLLSAGISYIADEEKAFKTLTDLGAENQPEDVCGGKYANVDIVTAVAIAGQTGDRDCFCEQIFFGVLNSFSLPNNLTLLAENATVPTVANIFDDDQFCAGFLLQSILDIATQVAISFSTLVLNVVIFAVLYATAGFVRYPNYGRKEFVVMRRLFVLTFVNTALIVLIVNADLVSTFGIPKEAFLRVGDFVDFSAEWYQQVGLEIIVIGLLNVLAPHVYPLTKAFYRVLLRKFTHPLSQTQLNELYLGPEFQLSFRFAQLTMMIWYILMYSTGIPLMYVFGFLSCIVTYWVDKYMFLRVCRSPPQYDVNLAAWSNGSLLWAVVLHVLIGFWMISSPVLFPASDEDSALGIIEAFSSGTGTNLGGFFINANVTGLQSLVELGNSIVRRATREQSIPYVVMFALLLVGRLGSFILSNGAEAFVRPCLKGFYNLCTCFRPRRAKVSNSADITEVNGNESFGIASYAILANPKYSHAFQLQDQSKGSNLKELLAGNIEAIETLTDAIDRAKAERDDEEEEKRKSFAISKLEEKPEILVVAEDDEEEDEEEEEMEEQKQEEDVQEEEEEEEDDKEEDDKEEEEVEDKIEETTEEYDDKYL